MNVMKRILKVKITKKYEKEDDEREKYKINIKLFKRAWKKKNYGKIFF